MAGGAAKALDEHLAFGAAFGRAADGKIRVRFLGLLLAEEQGQRRALVAGQGEGWHAVVAVEAGGIGEPGGEETGWALVGNVRQVAAAEPTAPPKAIAPYSPA